MCGHVPTNHVKLRQRHDFTDREIVQLQKNIDVWYVSWVSITGREGTINYIHMLCAGHMAYYLEKYRNVYHFSNQACEPLKKGTKRMYLTKTQKGGASFRITS